MRKQYLKSFFGNPSFTINIVFLRFQTLKVGTSSSQSDFHSIGRFSTSSLSFTEDVVGHFKIKISRGFVQLGNLFFGGEGEGKLKHLVSAETFLPTDK